MSTARRYLPTSRQGDQRGDLRDLQGGPAAEGGGSCGQHRRFGALEAIERCVPLAGIRLHTLRSALRQELEKVLGAHRQQEGHARPAFRD